ncbi:hypothetical protein LSUB1_G008378, partial [Lachnellula subtilissima]
ISSTLDPRSALYNPPDVLKPPSLIDVSECSSSDGTRGEAAVELHDDSLNAVQHDRTELVSEASQHVAEEGMVLDPSLSAEFSNPVLPSPSVDDESGNHTSISPASQTEISSESMNGLVPSPCQSMSSASRVSWTVTENIAYITLPDGTFKCPKCPRTFREERKASRHLQDYRHAHACTVPGCTWSYSLPKDLRRHSNTHNPQARRYNCPHPDCVAGPRTLGMSFARPDLLNRHMRNAHQ